MSTDELIPSRYLRQNLPLPEVSELDVGSTLHPACLELNACIDTTFYPLGSCTMKYNPKINEDAARLAWICPDSSLPGRIDGSRRT